MQSERVGRMAENNGFRTQLNGFHKEDVLGYIADLQKDYEQETNRLREQAQTEREAYEQALKQANDELARQFAQLNEERSEQERLQTLISQLYEANREMAAQVDGQPKICEEDLRQLERLKAENRQLSEQNRLLSAKSADDAAVRVQTATLKRENEQLQAQLSQYRQLVGDVGRFVVEVRAMGAQYLEEANQRCGDRLSALQQAVAQLNEDTAKATAQLHLAEHRLEEQHTDSQNRLEQLAQELERSASANASSSRNFF